MDINPILNDLSVVFLATYSVVSATERLQYSGPLPADPSDWRPLEFASESGGKSWGGLKRWRRSQVVMILFGILLLVGLVISDLLVGVAALSLFALEIAGRGSRQLGRCGADQMALLMMAVQAVVHLAPSDATALVVRTFIFLQLVLCYATSGLTKILSDNWTKRNVLIAILGGKAFGSKPLALPLLRMPLLTRGLAWCTIIWEVTFPVVLFAPVEVTLGFFCVGVLFHVGTALMMGLNTFVYAFLSAYLFVSPLLGFAEIWFPSGQHSSPLQTKVVEPEGRGFVEPVWIRESSPPGLRRGDQFHPGRDVLEQPEMPAAIRVISKIDSPTTANSVKG